MSRLMTICFIFRFECSVEICVWAEVAQSAQPDYESRCERIIKEEQWTWYMRAIFYRRCSFSSLLQIEMRLILNQFCMIHFTLREQESERDRGGRTNTIDITNGKEDTKCAWLTNLKLLKRTDNCIGRLK